VELGISGVTQGSLEGQAQATRTRRQERCALAGAGPLRRALSLPYGVAPANAVAAPAIESEDEHRVASPGHDRHIWDRPCISKRLGAQLGAV
jgi:hypothetical protein